MQMRWKAVMAVLIGAILLPATGCSQAPPQYGIERPTFLPGRKRQAWAVAPVVNLSGQRAVDPLLQADLVFQQLQQVEGVTAIPVNRTVEVLASLRLERVQSEQQAALVCELLGCLARRFNCSSSRRITCGRRA